MSDAAVELCNSVAEFRRVLNASHQASTIDAVAKLDTVRPNWRASLPFETEDDDIRLLVESMIQTTQEPAAGLFVKRYVQRKGNEWQTMLEIELSGQLDARRLPSVFGAWSQGETRFRVMPRGHLTSIVARPIAALERLPDDIWDVRPLVSKFVVRYPFEEQVRLAICRGDHTQEEFPALGGDAIDAALTVLGPSESEAPDSATQLEFLGFSSVRSRRPWLALMAPRPILDRVEFDGHSVDLGQVENSDRAIIAFFGNAHLNQNSEQLRWQTDCESEEIVRLGFMGPIVRGLLEVAFRGFPTVKQFSEDSQLDAREQTLHWRPKGHGTWRPVSGSRPLGLIDVAARHSGETVAWASAIILPSDFQIHSDVRRGVIAVSNIQGGIATATGSEDLSFERTGDGIRIDVSRISPGTSIQINLLWEAHTKITLQHASLEKGLLSPDGSCTSRPRMTLAVNRLHGYRLFSAQARRLAFELSESTDGRRPGFTRLIDGEAPLISHLDDIRGLLGSTESLDSRVRLYWIGESNHFLEIGWHDLDPGSYERRWFEASKSLSNHVVESLLAVRLIHPQHVEQISLDEETSSFTLVQRLRTRNLQGVWLVFGNSRSGETIRPRVVTIDKSPTDERIPAGLAEIVELSDLGTRQRTLLSYLARTDSLIRDDVDLIIETALSCQERGLPMVTFDLLTALSRTPSAAIHCLAKCRNIEERTAILRIEQDFPFLWCTTPIKQWIEQFHGACIEVETRLRSIGMDGFDARIQTFEALAQIVDMVPALAGHVRMVSLLLSPQPRPTESDGGISAIMSRLSKRSELLGMEDGFRSIAGELVRKRTEGSNLAPNLGLRAWLADRHGPWENFDSAFEDVIAAPYLAALAATDQKRESALITSLCRTARLFDPEYFDKTVAAAVDLYGPNSNAPIPSRGHQ